MKDLTQKEGRVLEMLRFADLRGRDIAANLGTHTREVSRIVANIRKKFTKGYANASYVFLSKNGYTLQETPENLYYEGHLRLRRGTSLIMNGKHIYDRCKQIDLGGYNTLRLEFYPRATKIVENLHKEEVREEV